jgi:hypothetical protein
MTDVLNRMGALAVENLIRAMASPLQMPWLDMSSMRQTGLLSEHKTKGYKLAVKKSEQRSYL